MDQPGRVTLPESPVVWDEDEIEEFEGVDSDDGDWYAIRTDPWPCPACQVEFEYVTGAHHVIVAPERDDLLGIAAACMKVQRNPRIVLYEDNLPCMTLFQWQAMGRPVHGMKKV